MTTAKTLSIEEKLACSVDDLPLSTRGNCVIRIIGLKTIKDLVDTDAKDLMSARNCGKKTIIEIFACLKMAGLKMKNSDGIIPDDVIEDKIVAIREYLAYLREPKPKVETFADRITAEIMERQIRVMQLRVTGATYSAIGKEIGRTGHTARIYLIKLGRALVREAKKRELSVAELLLEKNIPLAAIELMRQDGLAV